MVTDGFPIHEGGYCGPALLWFSGRGTSGRASTRDLLR